MPMMLAGGIGAILLGLPYIFYGFGPTEAEVVTWGRISIYIGASLILLSIGIGHSHASAAKALLSLGYIGLGLIQLLPIFLWFTFHGSGIRMAHHRVHLWLTGYIRSLMSHYLSSVS